MKLGIIELLGWLFFKKLCYYDYFLSIFLTLRLDFLLSGHKRTLWLRKGQEQKGFSLAIRAISWIFYIMYSSLSLYPVLRQTDIRDVTIGLRCILLDWWLELLDQSNFFLYFNHIFFLINPEIRNGRNSYVIKKPTPCKESIWKSYSVYLFLIRFCTFGMPYFFILFFFKEFDSLS